MTKTCFNCGVNKPKTEFNKMGKNRISPYCKSCIKLRWDKYKLTDKYKATRLAWIHSENGKISRKKGWTKSNNSPKNKNKILLRLYGITLLEKGDMLIKQNGRCAICLKSFKDSNDACVDHNHKYGTVRGILCNRCNRAAGLLHDDFNVAQNMYTYLWRHEKHD